MHEDREAWTIYTVVVAAAATAADVDDYDNDDDGEKETIQFINHYFPSTCRFVTEIHL